jgi:hypothetical protein
LAPAASPAPRAPAPSTPAQDEIPTPVQNLNVAVRDEPIEPVAMPATPVARTASTETADLEKSDDRHKAARRFARLAVSEIILYHEAEVREGRKAKDLWLRLRGDIKLCLETYEKRVPQEVRDRYDYLYDEVVRQLAEGDPEKLGPGAPWATP